jgi:predicted DNA-binding transcriptional regulator YafY
MPVNRNALIRYKTIDSCLRNKYRKWTLENLIEKVSDTLYELEGIDKIISKRTIQADIQMMRSDKLGYFAPIIVIDKKYYTYEDPNYSITNIPVSDLDLKRMNEAVELLKQFKGFSHFDQLNEVVQKLEDHVYANVNKKHPVIDFEKNENLKGLNYLDFLYQSIIQKKVISVTYKSFKASQENTFNFHAWWLKEFKNRWFVVGVRSGEKYITHLALDRILNLETNEGIDFKENQNYDPEEFYKQGIGVTISENLRSESVKIFIKKAHAPYVETKPLHHTQTVLERNEDGIIIEIKVQLNFELEKEILGFGEEMTVLSPQKLVKRINYRLEQALKPYRPKEILD